MPKKDVQSYISCEESGCDWDTYDETEERVQVLWVLHMVVKHPQEYFNMTGKDPEEVMFQYKDWLNTFRSRL